MLRTFKLELVDDLRTKTKKWIVGNFSVEKIKSMQAITWDTQAGGKKLPACKEVSNWHSPKGAKKKKERKHTHTHTHTKRPCFRPTDQIQNVTTET